MRLLLQIPHVVPEQQLLVVEATKAALGFGARPSVLAVVKYVLLSTFQWLERPENKMEKYSHATKAKHVFSRRMSFMGNTPRTVQDISRITNTYGGAKKCNLRWPTQNEAYVKIDAINRGQPQLLFVWQAGVICFIGFVQRAPQLLSGAL